MDSLEQVRTKLLARYETLSNKANILKAPEIKQLFAQIPTMPSEERGKFGQAVNDLQNELKQLVDNTKVSADQKKPIDVTAPVDINSPEPLPISSLNASVHPLSTEIEKICDIFYRMGFVAEESREIDDQYHMFESLNFPKGHPARDDWDTFMTVETDTDGDPLIAPAHTSTMQNRILKKYRNALLEKNEPISAIIPDRTFRNEDLDARHEHTFYQVEGIYVSKGVHAGMLVATLQTFLEEYYGQKLKVRVNPFYFPFTEPSFEFALSCPFCDSKNTDCKVCSGEGWIELLGCGMIHPNVLKAANIDPTVYTGFAFGCGIDRLVMMKYQIEDVRYLESARLDFLKQFS